MLIAPASAGLSVIVYTAIKKNKERKTGITITTNEYIELIKYWENVIQCIYRAAQCCRVFPIYISRAYIETRDRWLLYTMIWPIIEGCVLIRGMPPFLFVGKDLIYKM